MLFSFTPLGWGQTQKQICDSIADTLTLDEVVILQKLVKHSVQKDIYTISSRIRERSYSVMDILKNLPGVNIDNLSQQISIKMDNRVVILVNGMERPKEYIQSLTTGQIAKVEILNVLPKKYSLTGMRYGINIITNDNVGHHVNIQNFLMYSPGRNGNDNIANIQPRVSYMYIGKKLKLDASYGYADIHWNYPIAYQRIVGTTNEISQEVSPKSPNDFNLQRMNNMNLGLDYSCGENSVIYLRSSFSHTNESQFDKISFYDANLSGLLLEDEYFGNSSKYNDLKQTIGYNGKFNNKLSISASIDYNYRRNVINSVYQDVPNSSTNKYTNKKSYFMGYLSGDYALTETISINGGYSFMWNQYYSTSHESTLSSNIFRHHDLFSYIDATLGNCVSIHAGLNFEHFTNNSQLQNAYYTKVLPTLQIAYNPYEWLQLTSNYDVQMTYPNQNQLSEINYQLGNNIWFKGVSTLRPTKTSVYSLQATLWDNLMLGIGYENKSDNISSMYYQEATGISKIMVNNRTSSWSFMAMYDWQILHGLSFKNSINIEQNKLYFDSGNRSYTNVIIDSRLDWVIVKASFAASIDFSKNLVRNPLIQGYNETGQNLWEISLRKSFFNKRLSVYLDYCPPIRLFTRNHQKSVIDTPFYKETQSLNLHTYDNLFMMRLIFNLHHGAKGKFHKSNSKFIGEEKKGRGLL
jgi:hypothetical protein